MKGWLLLGAALMSGCETPNKPPLPKFALGAAPPTVIEDEKWAATVNRADVIYFGLTKRSAAESEAAWQLVETLQRNRARVALGWTELSAAQQPILDQWQRAEISPQQLLDPLGVRARADRLRHALRPDLVQVALGSPRELLHKIRAGIALTEEERASLPKFYRSRPNAFDDFADRASTSASLRRYNVNDLFRAPRRGTDDSGAFAELPKERPALLARRRGGLLKVVNCAPRAFRNDRDLPTPGLRT